MCLWQCFYINQLDPDLQVCKLLLTTGKINVKEVSQDSFTPLLTAAEQGHLKVCEMLLAIGSVVEETLPTGNTALHLAAEGGHIEVLDLLLAKGSDLEETKRRTGMTALHFAVLHGHPSIVKLLLSHKVEVSSRTTGGVTPLFGARKEGHHAIVVALLQAGADPLLPLISGDLPIHAAAQPLLHQMPVFGFGCIFWSI